MLATVFYAQGLLMDTAAIAAVALVGYLFGRRMRGQTHSPHDAKLLDELARAGLIAAQLEHLASRLAAETGAHRTSFAGLKSQIAAMQTGGAAADWPKLRQCADGLFERHLAACHESVALRRPAAQSTGSTYHVLRLPHRPGHGVAQPAVDGGAPRRADRHARRR